MSVDVYALETRVYYRLRDMYDINCVDRASQLFVTRRYGRFMLFLDITVTASVV